MFSALSESCAGLRIAKRLSPCINGFAHPLLATAKHVAEALGQA
jgi:hypothetical protein